MQQDATLPLEEIASRVGASRTPVWNRIRRLRDQGVIRAQVALRSSAGTGTVYRTTKNRRNTPDRLVLRKFDPVVRRHASRTSTSRAAPSATAMKGAVQGVATTVARIPVKNEPSRPRLCCGSNQ